MLNKSRVALPQLKLADTFGDTHLLKLLAEAPQPVKERPVSSAPKKILEFKKHLGKVQLSYVEREREREKIPFNSFFN